MLGYDRMFYDLNVPWNKNQVELQKTLSFLSERLLDSISLVSSE